MRCDIGTGKRDRTAIQVHEGVDGVACLVHIESRAESELLRDDQRRQRIASMTSAKVRDA
jgi:hypothetical protein